MADQTAPDVTGDDRRLAREWAERIVNGFDPSLPMETAAARVILDTVPAPSPPTLADMTLDEQDECAGMQADLAQGDSVVILDGTPDAAGLVQVLEKSLDVYRAYPAEVTPRPDLPRLTWPGTEKPAPDLPGDWRIADHKENGRVMVTTAPDRYRRVYYVLHVPEGGMGFDWRSCDDSELTYLDGDQEDDQ